LEVAKGREKFYCETVRLKETLGMRALQRPAEEENNFFSYGLIAVGILGTNKGNLKRTL